MGERKVLNRYFPPDFDPAALPKRKRPMTNDMKVRMMLPMSVRCKTCGNFMYKGTKFNTRKEDVMGENYLGIQIFRFYYRCTKCAAEFTMKTDPQNSDYVLEEGATRNYEHWRENEKEKAEAIAAREEEEMGNAMKALENRTLESKREMDIMAALDEMRALKSRHAKITTEEALAALQREADKQNEGADGAEAGEPADIDDLAEFYRLRRAAHASRLQDSDEDEDGGGREGGAGPSGAGGSRAAGGSGAGARRTAGAGLSLAAAAFEEDEEEGQDYEPEAAATGRGSGDNGVAGAGGHDSAANAAGQGASGAEGAGPQGAGQDGGGPQDPLKAALGVVRGEQGTGPSGAAAASKPAVVRPQVKVVAKKKAAGNGQAAEGLGLGDYGGQDNSDDGKDGGAGLPGLLGGYGSSSPESS